MISSLLPKTFCNNIFNRIQQINLISKKTIYLSRSLKMLIDMNANLHSELIGTRKENQRILNVYKKNTI